MAIVNYYYSETQADECGEEEGALYLCRACAANTDAQWLSAGHDEAECGHCNATNNPARTAELNALFAKAQRSNDALKARRAQEFWSRYDHA